MLNLYILAVFWIQIIFALEAKYNFNNSEFIFQRNSTKIPDESTNYTLTVSNFGSFCNSNVACNYSTYNAVCQASTCTCPEKYPIYIEEDHGCFQKKNVNEDCINSKQCVAADKNSFCLNNTCSCNNTLSLYMKNKCYSYVFIGEACDIDSQCSQMRENTYCHLKRCFCSSDFPIIINGYCYKKAHLGESCIADSQCTSLLEKTYCFKSKCACLPDYPVNIHGRCYRKTHLGDYCVTSEQCHFMVDNSYCKMTPEGLVGICDCLAGFTHKWHQCLKEEISNQSIVTTEVIIRADNSDYLKIIVASSVAATVSLLLFIIVIFVKKNEIRFQILSSDKCNEDSHKHFLDRGYPSINGLPNETDSCDVNKNNWNSFRKESFDRPSLGSDSLPPIYNSIIHEISFPVKKPGHAVLAHNFLISLEEGNPGLTQMRLCPANI